MTRLLNVAIVGLLGILGACSSSTEDEPDAGATLACVAFQDLANDYNDGIITLSETRDRMVDIEDDASVSEEPGVASRARELLAALTALESGESVDAGAAVTAFADACRRATGAG